MPPPDDRDNVPAAIEDRVPGLGPGSATGDGDGNGDGVADSLQPAVSSVSIIKSPTAQSNPGGGTATYVTLVTNSANGKIDPAHADHAFVTSIVQKDAPAGRPESLDMPLGLLDFVASVPQNGVSETFSLYVDMSLGVNGYWVMHNGIWTNLASAAYGGKVVMEGGKLRLDFKLADGGEFDIDGKSDGSVGSVGAVGHMPLSLVGYAPGHAGSDFTF